ncbi:hypothetical protein [Nocardia panacis]|nr:hypothetical protein [Nocardia panacis]
MSFKTFNAIGVGMTAPVAASRGILALQGIGLSFGSAFDTMHHLADSRDVFAQSPIESVIQDMSHAGWHPAFAEAAVGAIAIDNANKQAYLPFGVDKQAARLRAAHPASVNRSRHRCRPR